MNIINKLYIYIFLQILIIYNYNTSPCFNFPSQFLFGMKEVV